MKYKLFNENFKSSTEDLKSVDFKSKSIINYKDKCSKLFLNKILQSSNKLNSINYFSFIHSISSLYINIKIFSPFNKIEYAKNIKALFSFNVKNTNNINNINNISNINNINNINLYKKNQVNTRSLLLIYEYYLSIFYNKKVQINTYFYSRPYNNAYIYNNIMKFYFDKYVTLYSPKRKSSGHNRNINKFSQKLFKIISNHSVNKKILVNSLDVPIFKRLLEGKTKIRFLTEYEIMINKLFNSTLEKDVKQVLNNYSAIHNNKNLLFIIIKHINEIIINKQILGAKIINRGKVNSFRSKSLKLMKGSSKLNVRITSQNNLVVVNCNQSTLTHNLGLTGLTLILNTTPLY